MKRCYFCKETKELNFFYNDKRSKDGKTPKCISCHKLYAKSDRTKEVLKEYRKSDKRKKYIRRFREENREYLLFYGRERHKNNHGTAIFYSADQRVRKLTKQPKWIKNYYNEIKEIYNEVEDIQWLSEKKLVVDHIIPLRGKNVSGLHVPWNLQVLSEYENKSKRNKFDGTSDNKTWRISCANR